MLTAEPERSEHGRSGYRAIAVSELAQHRRAPAGDDTIAVLRALPRPAAVPPSGAWSIGDQERLRSAPAAIRMFCMTAPFAEIYQAALTRHGKAGVEARLTQPKNAAELGKTADDRFLSEMSRRIFRAG